MAGSMERFTAWLSVAERDQIRKQADELGTSENHVLRLIIRERYGLATPAIRSPRSDDSPERV